MYFSKYCSFTKAVPLDSSTSSGILLLRRVSIAYVSFQNFSVPWYMRTFLSKTFQYLGTWLRFFPKLFSALVHAYVSFQNFSVTWYMRTSLSKTFQYLGTWVRFFPKIFSTSVHAYVSFQNFSVPWYIRMSLSKNFLLNKFVFKQLSMKFQRALDGY
jgi:hypothetical protein